MKMVPGYLKNRLKSLKIRLTEPLLKSFYRKKAGSAERAITDTLGGERDVFFVQIGSNYTEGDPASKDPICSLIKNLGWKGVFVDPQEKALDSVRRYHAGNQDGLKFANVAVNTYDGETSFTVRSMSAVSSMGAHPGMSSYFDVEAVVVPCLRLDTLIKKYGISKIDLLQIDIEGFEWIVLESLEALPFRPKVVCFEYRWMPMAKKITCRSLLKRLGYRKMAQDYLNQVYVLEH